MLVKNPVLTMAGDVTVIQFATEFMDTFDYISFSNALKDKLVTITEVNSAGSVNDLMIENKSGEFVFFSDGDLLQGAKQNRVLNTSVLIKPHSKIIVPVSCVEAGRWRYTRSDFSESDFYAPSKLRFAKQFDILCSLREGRGHRSDQGKVWKEVSDYEDLHGESSPTSDMLNTFGKKEHLFSKEIIDIFPEAGTNSAAIFIGTNLYCVESFNSSEVYREYFRKLLRTAMMDSVNRVTGNSISRDNALKELEDFVSTLSDLNFNKNKAVGEGDERRFSNDELSCYELSYGGKPIHIAALLNTEKKRDKIYRDSRGMIVINFGHLRGRTFRDILRNDYDYAMRIMLSPELSEQMKRELFEEALRYAPNR